MQNWRGRAATVAPVLAIMATIAVLVAVTPAERPEAGPLRPEDDGLVLARVPRRTAAEIELASRLASRPDDPEVAVMAARAYLERASVEDDPRFVGYAQALLRPWWHLEDPPVPVLLARAALRQRNHEFAQARADLDRAVARAPDDPQAWLDRATLQVLAGELDAAAASCAEVERLAPGLIGVTCTALVDGSRGRAAASAARLTSALAAAPPNTPVAVRRWAGTLRAELLARAGDPAAEAAFRELLAQVPPDEYLRNAWADFLLDQGRPREALEALGDTMTDGGLLRRAIAEDALGHPALAAHREELAARFDAEAARGDRIHLRERARFELSVRHDPAAALEAARANWAVQREPIDLRLLVEAAAAAGDPGAAAEAVEHFRRTGLEDPAITRAVARLKP